MNRLPQAFWFGLAAYFAVRVSDEIRGHDEWWSVFVCLGLGLAAMIVYLLVSFIPFLLLQLEKLGLWGAAGVVAALTFTIFSVYDVLGDGQLYMTQPLVAIITNAVISGVAGFFTYVVFELRRMDGKGEQNESVS